MDSGFVERGMDGVVAVGGVAIVVEAVVVASTLPAPILFCRARFFMVTFFLGLEAAPPKTNPAPTG